MKTFIIAPKMDEARQKAKELGLPPHGRDVVLVTSGERLHGCTITPEDQVHVVRRGAVRSSVWENLFIARVVGGSA